MKVFSQPERAGRQRKVGLGIKHQAETSILHTGDTICVRIARFKCSADSVHKESYTCVCMYVYDYHETQLPLRGFAS